MMNTKKLKSTQFVITIKHGQNSKESEEDTHLDMGRLQAKDTKDKVREAPRRMLGLKEDRLLYTEDFQNGDLTK